MLSEVTIATVFYILFQPTGARQMLRSKNANETEGAPFPIILYYDDLKNYYPYFAQKL